MVSLPCLSFPLYAILADPGATAEPCRQSAHGLLPTFHMAALSQPVQVGAWLQHLFGVVQANAFSDWEGKVFQSGSRNPENTRTRLTEDRLDSPDPCAPQIPGHTTTVSHPRGTKGIKNRLGAFYIDLATGNHFCRVPFFTVSPQGSLPKIWKET